MEILYITDEDLDKFESELFEELKSLNIYPFVGHDELTRAMNRQLPFFAIEQKIMHNMLNGIIKFPSGLSYRVINGYVEF